MDNLTFLDNIGTTAVEELYAIYKADPTSLDRGWQKFFEGFEFALTDYSAENSDMAFAAEFKVIDLILDYRNRGHLFTKTNPVRIRRKYTPTLDIENFGLKQDDLKKVFKAGSQIGIGAATLENILAHLQQTYCQSIGVEYMYIRTPEIVQWLKKKMETGKNTPTFTKNEKLRILGKLTQAVVFEKFIHNKFPGQKSFSLSGCETLIPAMDAMIEKGADSGCVDYVIGMAHRGRLNILANILHKSYESIFSEFRGIEFDDAYLVGDVKYHLGSSSDTETYNGKKIRLQLAPNPSHLEAVNPVIEGIVRAKLDNEYDGNTDKIVPVLIHGDASVAGQGIIYEVLQMSQLDGYKTGGSIHLVINNQLGFTTNYLDGRSSVYCTDVAKTIQVPIFHVNADDVEAVVYVMQLAVEFRQKFHRDIFIDLLCYRKYGHNESDEPRYTQPLLYKAIEQHPDPAKIYIEKLVTEKIIDNSENYRIDQCLNTLLEGHFSESIQIKKEHISPILEETWKDVQRATDKDFNHSPETAVDKQTLLHLGQAITKVPEGLNIFRKIIRILQDRNDMLVKSGNIDWAFSEHLAWASLLNEGHSVRVSGQDVERGTFSQRHAVLRIEDSEEEFIPLAKACQKAKFTIYNSLLSEYGVLGFEYGYAMATPDMLTIWEAQFGDFGNGAQIIIDQFLCCAEEKWNIMNGLVLLLPHGYEGQGPEHSSARIERYLSLCADNNIQVVNCTTPANYFHVLRRQLKRNFRKPLIIFTPKSLLRNAACVSPIAEFAEGGFREIIDIGNPDPAEVKRIIFCSGKVFYDLRESISKADEKRIALIRVEQLYPLPAEQISAVVAKYNNAKDIIWLQEEPENMGAWSFVLRSLNNFPLRVIARPESGSTATGSAIVHLQQQKELMAKALNF